MSVQQTIQKGGEQYLLIERPDNQTQLIPINWTDQAIVKPAASGACFTPGQLLTLRRWLDNHLQTSGLDEKAGIVSLKAQHNPSGGNDDEEENKPIQSTSILERPNAESTPETTGPTGNMGAAGLGDKTNVEHTAPPTTGRSR